MLREITRKQARRYEVKAWAKDGRHEPSDAKVELGADFRAE
jgi:hypothetical protein